MNYQCLLKGKMLKQRIYAIVKNYGDIRTRIYGLANFAEAYGQEFMA